MSDLQNPPAPVDPGTAAPDIAAGTPPPSGSGLPPAATFGPPARQGKRTAMIVGGVVTLTAVFGGGAVLANSIGDPGAADKPVVVDGPNGVNADIGPAIDPSQGPAIPDVPDTAVGPGPQPPPPTAPPDTVPDIPVTPEVTGQRIDVGAGVSIAVPTGWEVLANQNGLVGLGTDGGNVWITIYTNASAAEFVVRAELDETSKFVQQLEITDTASVSAPTSAVVDAEAALWKGVFANSQGGSGLVEGVTFGYVRLDGVGIGVTQMNVDGAWDDMAADVRAIFASIDYGTPQGNGG